MKVFATILFLGAFLVLIGMPERTLGFRTTTPVPPPGPHEFYNECGGSCEPTCATLIADEHEPCILMCKRGNFCIHGYIRQSEDGPCILPSECPARVKRSHESSESSESSESHESSESSESAESRESSESSESAESRESSESAESSKKKKHHRH